MSTKKNSITKNRRTMQWIGVAATFLIGLRHVMPGEASRGGSFDSFCPVGGLETFLPYLFTGQTLKTTNLLNFTILLGVVGVGLVAGRAFCGYMCPLGTLQDFIATWARRLSGEQHHVRGKFSKARFPIHIPRSVDRWLGYLKYAVLLFVLVTSLVTVYPPLHAFCPARAVFSFQLTNTLLWSVLFTFVATSGLVERFWCKYLCPLGALLAPLNKISPLRIEANTERCNACGRCDNECPMGIQDIPENLTSVECVRCLECLDTCARDDALTLRIG